eukprot:4909166-Heterocapsa_arctica.AAC.1
MASFRIHIPTPPEVPPFVLGGYLECSRCGPGRGDATLGPLPGIFAWSSGSDVASESPRGGSGREVAAPRSSPG